MELQLEVDPLEKFREQVAAEKAEPRDRMSDAQKARLRAVNEADRADRLATGKFLAAFKRLPKDTRTLVEVLKRIFKADQTAVTIDEDVRVSATLTTPAMLERMANKLLWGLSHGWFPTSVGDVVFLGELTPDELAMSDDKFYRHLEEYAPKNPITLNVKQAIEVAPATSKREWWTPERCKEQGLCKAGKLCVFATGKGKPKVRLEGKQFCGKVCQEAYPIRVRNQKAKDLVN